MTEQLWDAFLTRCAGCRARLARVEDLCTECHARWFRSRSTHPPPRPDVAVPARARGVDTGTIRRWQFLRYLHTTGRLREEL
jgi:hypothetical protein